MGADEYFECIKNIDHNLLSLIGRGYVIDWCVSALKKKREELVYRTYITDALKAIAENTAQYVGASGLVKAGVTLERRYYDIVQESRTANTVKKEEHRTAEEVVENIKSKLTKLGGTRHEKEK